MMNRILACMLLLTLTAVSGCGGGGATGGQPVYATSGVVTFHGTPLPGATVAFAPTTSGQPTAIGKTDPNGKFELTTYDYGDGAAAGQFKVVITKSLAAKKADTKDSHGDADYVAKTGSHDAASEQAGAGEALPAQYTSSSNTPLTADVKSGSDNVFQFDLE